MLYSFGHKQDFGGTVSHFWIKVRTCFHVRVTASTALAAQQHPECFSIVRHFIMALLSNFSNVNHAHFLSSGKLTLLSCTYMSKNYYSNIPFFLFACVVVACCNVVSAIVSYNQQTGKWVPSPTLLFFTPITSSLCTTNQQVSRPEFFCH